jgi:hypothetical protein
MRTIPSPLEALAGLAALGVAALVIAAPALAKALRDIWVLINALAQPAR